MPLKETREELYKPEAQIGGERKYESPFAPEKAHEEGKTAFAGKEKWEKQKDTMIFEKKRAVLYGSLIVGGVVLVLLSVIGVVKFKQASFLEENVTVSVVGPDGVKGADLVEYEIRVANDNRVDLLDTEIRLDHSANFKVESSDAGFERQGENNTLFMVGEVKSHEQKTIKVSGRFFAPKDYIVYLKPTARFTPSNFSSVFERNTQVLVNVNSAPMSLSVGATGEVLSNGVVEYFFQYGNVSDVVFSNVKLELDYPDGFDYSQSDKSPSEGNNIWLLGDLAPGQSGSIKVIGALKGAEGDRGVVRASLGTINQDNSFVLYSKGEDVTRVVSSPLMIETFFDNSRNINVNLGRIIPVHIRYSNNGTRGFRDAIIHLSLDSPIVDLPNLFLENGHYDSSTKSIIWKVADIPELSNLSPGDSGDITLIIPIKESLDVEKSSDSNYSLESSARIESSDVVYGSVGKVEGYSEKAVAKLNSDVSLESGAYYRDFFIQNSGPIPPKVGQETTYTIHWTVRNLSNDLSGVQVRSFLPTGVHWKGDTYPGGESVKFNERTNEVIWEVGALENGTGYFLPSREVRFRVGIVPEVNQIGNTVNLLQNSTLSGKDTFTDADLSVKKDPVTTGLAEGDKETMNIEGYSSVRN